MRHTSRRFGAWVTGSRSDPFHRARLGLTLVYVIIIALIFLAGYLFELWLDKLVNESMAEFLLYFFEAAVILLVAGLSFWLSGLTLRPIERMHKQQKTFIADAAHELRTPLSVMKTGTESLLADKAATKGDHQILLRDSLEEIDGMADLVNDLLFLARHDAFQEDALVKVNLAKIVARQTAQMNAYATKQLVTIDSDLGGPAYVRGNTAQLKRLCANLLKNAIDYNEPNGTVALSLERSGSSVSLTIVDSGIGLSKHHQIHVFERFYKVDPARSGQTSGAGLGLAIVQQIVLTHGGEITLTSQLGKGTTVIIKFPDFS